MSWGTCVSGSNNIHFDFPPIMMDGRNFADWQPGSVVNKKLREDAGIRTNNEYRQYMINNADKIIKYNQVQSCDECCSSLALYGGYNTPNSLGSTSTNSPYLYKSCSDNSVPFGYEASDLKNVYLSRQELQRNMNVPLLSQEQLFQLRHVINSDTVRY